MLKERLLTLPALKFINVTKPFEVHIDTNKFAIRGMLVQERHPITFENKKLVKAQLRWPTHEEELFIMASCFKC